ncbi:MAG: MFS transporter [Candidatus Methanoplasma sp.]|jgi:sugar phosphate permease|nr:MFS transporter [Candidatus Methanoplasma sp.]
MVDLTSAKKELIRYRWVIFAVLTTAYFFVYFQRMAVGVVGIDIVGDVGGSVGILSSVYFWTYAVMQIPSGLLADHLGPRKASFIFLSVAAAGSLLTFTADSFWIVVVGKIMIAAGMAVVYIPLMKIISVWFGKKDFPELAGIVIAVGNVGAIAASAPLEALADATGWRVVYMILGAVTAILAVLCLVLVRDHPHKKGLPAVEELEEDDDPSDITDAKLPMIQGLKMVAVGGRRFWPLALAYFLIYGSIMVFQGTWAKVYFDNVYDFALSVVWFITAVGVGKIISTVIIGVLSTRGIIRSKRRAMLFGTLCFAGIWAAIWLFAGEVDSYWFWMAVSFMFGFFGGFMTLSFTQVKECYPVAISGTAVSAMNVFLFLGASVCTTITEAVIGTSYTLDSFSELWMIMFIMSTIAVLLIFFSAERTHSAQGN